MEFQTVTLRYKILLALSVLLAACGGGMMTPQVNPNSADVNVDVQFLDITPIDVIRDATVDVPDVRDSSDVIDVMDVRDVIDVIDVIDAVDVVDVIDVIDVVDVRDVVDVALCDAATFDATACSSGCVDLTTSALNCGRCGNACLLAGANTVPTCAGGVCNMPFVCATNYADCDRVTTNGCEVLLRNNPEHCGRCGVVCPSAINSVPVCLDGVCGTTCRPGFGNCDGISANGCEVDLTNTTNNCMTCGRVCTIGPDTVRARPACIMGSCSLACDSGYGNCDGIAINGCETALGDNVSHCGRCGNVCSALNATSACTMGACTYRCNPGFADCDGSPLNGCETNTNISVPNCGRCGNACPMVPSTLTACTAGVCSTMCASDRGDCDGLPSTGCETLIVSNPEHCGRCGNVCPGYSNASPSCVTGLCRPFCTTGYGNCDMTDTNGCEVNIFTSPRDCGACGRICPTGDNASPFCMGGRCALTCATNFADCDANAANGCELNISNSVDNCGACRRPCTLANATAGCAASACTLVSCNAGFSNCDGIVMNGCETTGACRDAGVDAAMEASVDAAREAGTDAAIEAGIDASVEVHAPCLTLADYTTATAVSFGGAFGNTYSPRCITVRVGMAVTWNGSFIAHPMAAGTGGSPSSPIPSTTTGTTATAMFGTAGYYPFYCTAHGTAAGTGMAGVVRVIP
jgi:plastocyanin